LQRVVARKRERVPVRKGEEHMKVRMTLVVAIAATVVVGTTATADFLGIEIEAIESGLQDGGVDIGTTYRIYALVDAGGEVDAVYGEEGSVLNIASTTSFYQNQFGGYGTPDAGLFGFFPPLEYDSFVTIGLLDDDGDAMLDIGIVWDDFEDNGGAIYTENGTWFATPDEPQVQEVGGRVLIAQLTTDGELSGTLSLQGKNEDLSNWNAVGVELPAPGALALLGLAGLVSRRRRK
jgi:MYXO-CTERM domain-containing protein